jgi:hypothetical protein
MAIRSGVGLVEGVVADIVQFWLEFSRSSHQKRDKGANYLLLVTPMKGSGGKVGFGREKNQVRVRLCRAFANRLGVNRVDLAYQNCLSLCRNSWYVIYSAVFSFTKFRPA